MTIIPDSHADILQSTAVAYIATIGPQGEPQVSAIWFGWNGTHLFFSMNGARQKVRNLRRDPHVAVAIADPANPYRSIELRGVARIAADPAHEYPDMLSHKYLSRDADPTELPQHEERVVVLVVPDHVVVFPPQQ